jgi:hypothetical protein
MTNQCGHQCGELLAEGVVGVKRSSAVGCSWAEDRVGVRQRGGRRRRRAAGRRRRSGRGGEEGRRIPSHPWQRDPRPPELPRLPFPRRGRRRERQTSAQDSRVCINLAPRAVDRSGVEDEDDGMGQFCLGSLRCVGFGMDGRSGASRQHVPCSALDLSPRIGWTSTLTLKSMDTCLCKGRLPNRSRKSAK